jgi:hypothetical protein
LASPKLPWSPTGLISKLLSMISIMLAYCFLWAIAFENHSTPRLDLLVRMLGKASEQA